MKVFVKSAVSNVNAINIALMLISCAAAFVVPFELLLASYAFLGPAHYLTQISWMHDRNYFTDQRGIWGIGIVLTLLIIGAIYNPSYGGNNAIYCLYAFALSGTISLIAAKKLWQRLTLGSIIFGFFMMLRGIFPDFVLALIILLPSVVHIYIFTGAFILFGALRSKSTLGLISFAVFIACGTVFYFITPTYEMIAPQFVTNNITMFDGISTYLADLLSFNGWVEGHAMLGFLAFAYTYHYLNWFSKVDLIKWHKMPKRRSAILAALYIASIGFYIYDYKTGFVVLLFLSILHVILEFPLNAITFKNLGQMMIPAKSKPT